MIVMATTAFILSCENHQQTTENPFLSAYDTPFGVPPFDRINESHFRPALEAGMTRHAEEVAAIATNPEPPTFDNTIVALEASGELLSTVNIVLNNLNSAHTSDSIQAIVKDMAPRLSAHQDQIRMNPQLFARVKTLWDNRDSLGLTEEQAQLLENTYKSFVRGGANLTDEDKARLQQINQELAVLTVLFNQNLLAETNAYELVIDNTDDLAGLQPEQVAAAAETAKERGKAGKWVFTLSNPSVMPFLQYAENRELRKAIWTAYQNRGNNGNAHDNNEILIKIANLRLQRANLLGYPTHAHYVLEEAMAETPDKVYRLLRDLWAPALKKAKAEAADIKQEIAAEGYSFEPAPYDWRYYAEKIRQKRYALNEAELKPYFNLPAVREGAFDVARRLYGLSFRRLENVPVYHPDVEVYEVLDRDGSHLGVLYADFFARPSKRVGAWMTSFRRQRTKNGERIAPVISIVCNFSRPVDNQPALLTFDDANTLFHEFGHALHGLLSNVTYESLSGTSVPRDFVELPSQVMENWAEDPGVLPLYAKHYQTGEVIPRELIEKMERAGTFDQGFATVEYLAASLLDMDYHTQTSSITLEASAFEHASMARYGLIDEIIPRYRSTYFQHIFSGGYSAGYYSYIWAEVLDADAFAAFKEKGLFDQATAESFRKNILERGGTGRPSELYRRFRGADPSPVHLMKKRGLN